MPSKKTGLFLSAISEPIVSRVMQEQGYTKISPAINFIILEYYKMCKGEKPHVVVEKKQEVVEVKEEAKEPVKDLSDWFVAEDKQ